MDARSRRRITSLCAAAAVTLSFAVGLVANATSASATTLPGPGPIQQRSASNPTADALPTVQIDGVVLAQVVVGNTVYAGGSFANARPAGAAAGTNLTPRSNMLAYDITTGNLITSFAPTLNGEIKAMALSPDSSTLYVGGQFTSVNGKNRYRLAAFSTATGALLNWAPNVDYTVNAITTTSSTVYVGGAFSTANGNPRTRLAAFTASSGALTTWAPTADYDVYSMTMTPDGSKVVIGGGFTNLNGSPVYGIGAVDPVSGASVPWPVNQTVQAYKVSTGGAGFLSLSVGNGAVYGTAYNFYGNSNPFEGTFSADNNGNLNWIEDCHGDTYGAFGINGTVYTISHAHYCGTLNGWPVYNPWQLRHSVAFTANVTGTLGHNQQGGYPDFYGHPSPSIIDWFPDLEDGTYTSAKQAAWSVSGNSQYIVEGGEFPTVNGTPQQGLVRFAVPSLAPNKQGPRLGGSNWVPTVTPVALGVARISIPANWSRDQMTLSYNFTRDSKSVYTTSAASEWWNTPTISFLDSGLTPGATYTYRVGASSPNGALAVSNSVTITMPTTGTPAPSDQYGKTIFAAQPTLYWRMQDASGPTAADSSGNNQTGTYYGGETFGVPSPVAMPNGTAVTFNGVNGTLASANSFSNPTVYSEEAWFKTTTTKGGKIIGFGDKQSGQSSNYDRHVFMNSNGTLTFGVWTGSENEAITSGSYNNGKWHQVVATQGPDGMSLYVDGQLAATNPQTQAQNFSGYWRVGGDTAWDGVQPWFAGTIGEVAVYPYELSAAQVLNHYSASAIAPATPPTASFTNSLSGLTASFDGSGSSASDGNPLTYSWDFGDGSAPSTAVAPTHTYSKPGSYSVKLTVTDDKGQTGSATQSITVTAPAPTAAFTATAGTLSASFNGTASTTWDGVAPTYSWAFGDGSAPGTGATPTHSYTQAGTYTVTLTVTDDQGLTGTVSHAVAVAGHTAPTAAFTSSASGLTASFDGSGSSAADGATITSYDWNFGDGSADGSGAAPTHTYGSGGSYNVTLTVTDSMGAKGVASHTVTVASATHTAPTASFTWSADALTASVDGSASSATGGATITSYAWTFGDNVGTATGATASYTYAAAGTYNVTLTVTDSMGGVGSTSQQVTITGQPQVLAQDSFARTTANGWGTADTGGAWTVAPRTYFATNGSAGTITIPTAGASASATLNGVSQSDVNELVDTSLAQPATGTGTYVMLLARQIGNSDYRLKERFLAGGAMHLVLSKVVSGKETIFREVNIPNVSYTPGDVYQLRFVVTGNSPTTLTGTVWKLGTTEPTTPQITATDSEPTLQAAGSVGTMGYISGTSTPSVTISLTDFLVVKPS